MVGLPFKQVTVFGLGLIGGSLAMAVRERFPDWRIQAMDTRPEALQYALKQGVIDKAALSLDEARATLDTKDPQLVVLAAHLPQNVELLAQLAPLVRERDVLVTDIGSCKRGMMEAGQKLLPAQFIAGHPMAGREVSGIEAATALLFTGKSYLLCPHAETDPERLEQLKHFVQAIGATPRLIDADRHDRYMAYVSHLPQLYSILLTNLLYRHEPGHLLAYHGGGLDDQLRLAASPYAMWGPIFNANRDNMTQVLSELRDMIDEVLPLLADGVEVSDPDTAVASLQPWFSRSNQIHQQFQALRAARINTVPSA